MANETLKGKRKTAEQSVGKHLKRWIEKIIDRSRSEF